MSTRRSPAATQADVRMLSVKTGSAIRRLDKKIDSSVRRLDEKIDSSVCRLDEKIDSSVCRLEEKIDSSVDRLAKEIVATQAGMREMRENMSTKSDIDRLISAIDSFAGQAQDSNRGVVLHGRALTETAVTLRDHEKRLSALEARAT